MKVAIYIILSISVLFYSCVSKSDYDKVLSEKDAIIQERDKLKEELEDIKYGAPNLLADGMKFYAAKNFFQSKIKFQSLLDKHPDMPQAIEAKKYIAIIDEEDLWQKANTSEDIGITEDYLSKYPDGKYFQDAATRKIELKKLNLEKAYKEAENINSSFVWKKFLENYPDYAYSRSIQERIIRLEVDEILGNSETGQIPSFNNYSNNFTSNSSVEITNNTGCTLIVRYSGIDAKMIEIPSRGTRKVFLSSGSYKIAASACGSNYAGSENLHGNYGSTFYISTTRF